MGEHALDRHYDSDDEALSRRRAFEVIAGGGAVRANVVAPVVDESGKVVRPAIDLDTERMPNGQPVWTFYDRGIDSDDVFDKAASVIAAARRGV